MHPYKALDERAFWATAVAQLNPLEINDLWEPKFAIDRQTKVAAYGSCFAQHFGRALRERGFSWHITETAPPGLSAEGRKKFNYDVFSARTGNIYTASLLKQWVSWALADVPVPEEIWRSGDRFFDPFRPAVEPGGFASEQELIATRKATIAAFRQSILTADVFVFTLGLTESWINSEQGFEYPMCPGTVAGEFDSSRHVFVNQEYPFIRTALAEAIKMIRQANPRVRVLLTVSPVPLTATNSGRHVLVATMESKSNLRAVAGALARQVHYVDYFPSYEIINAPTFRGAYFEPNQRTVAAVGVKRVMDTFFQCMHARFPISETIPVAESRTAVSVDADDVACEEELLAGFAPPLQQAAL